MKFSIILAALASTSMALVTTRVPKGYTVVPMTYRGVITEGGDEVELSGTIEDVHQQIKRLNPDFNVTQSLEAREADAEVHRILQKRNKSNLLCDIEGDHSETATYTWITKGIQYLLALDGVCKVGAGPGTCARISCSYDSGIYLCNDNAWEIEPKCSYLATYAEDIMTQCYDGMYINGQEFDTDNYNVIVAGDLC
ncbi:hypothetical protein BO86DRAFT_99954 [Aspergillus japonicus CBS 114.51]|uniref:Ig-like domain-containing protein n=2 Tax=Aspergillus TaxID=5052 RepID=A0A2V5GSN4_ASPV1|nr:hypothetical protein BO86DRAFT_99954 [Aspergillus japonicus CBS 114.51]PYI14289.1 hypothetical protein BO99DRAFT_450545 [Aspergillus violaceofuscus CBS 115571]RAH81290.1 hypothetical protein BO86DRAFT_99954 [Aspergillus japonicus CBS 114.51]